MASLKRILLFAHYDPDDLYLAPTLTYLNELKKHCEYCVLCSTGISEAAAKIFNGMLDSVILRANVGYDFLSWKIALNQVSNILCNYDEIVFCNDSVFAPYGDFNLIFSKMSDSPFDFWGLTQNRQFAPHVQSYFVVYKKKVFTSTVFKTFWDEVEALPNKWDIILKYEVGLSQKLTKAGFLMGSFFNPTRFQELSVLFRNLVFKRHGKIDSLKNLLHGNRAAINFTIDAPVLLLEQGVPMVKREALLRNPSQVHLPTLLKLMNQKNFELTTALSKILKPLN